jgi:hypothetical protein
MTGYELRSLLDRALELWAKSEDELRDLDSAIGDGDLGITVSRGAQAARQAIAALPPESTPSEIIRAVGTAIASANPSSFAARGAAGPGAEKKNTPNPTPQPLVWARVVG